MRKLYRQGNAPTNADYREGLTFGPPTELVRDYISGEFGYDSENDYKSSEFLRAPFLNVIRPIDLLSPNFLFKIYITQ